MAGGKNYSISVTVDAQLGKSELFKYGTLSEPPPPNLKCLLTCLVPQNGSFGYFNLLHCKFCSMHWRILGTAAHFDDEPDAYLSTIEFRGRHGG